MSKAIQKMESVSFWATMIMSFVALAFFAVFVAIAVWIIVALVF